MKDSRDDAAWTDPSRPPEIGSYLTNLGYNIWAIWMENQKSPYIWHWCDKNLWLKAGKFPALVGEPRWALGGTRAHEIVSVDPLTITPSLYWSDCCGTHGFITDGRWLPV